MAATNANHSNEVIRPNRAAVTLEAAERTELSGATAANVQSTASLTAMPVELQVKILGYLLLCQHVKNYSRGHQRGLYAYHFEMAILRTNQHFHDLGRVVFAENNFVGVSSYNFDIVTLDHLITHRQPSAEDDHHVRLHLRYALEPALAEDLLPQLHTVTVALVDLEHIVLQLRRLCLFSHRRTELKLEVKPYSNGRQLPLQLQKKLLDPVLKMRVRKQTCLIEGAVDDELANTIATHLTPIVHWQRVELVQIFDVIETTRLRADSAFGDKDVSLACVTYQWAWSIVKYIVEDDHQWDKKFHLNDTTMQNNFTSSVVTIVQNLLIGRLAPVLEPELEENQGFNSCLDCLEIGEDVIDMAQNLSAYDPQAVRDLNFLLAVAAVGCDEAGEALDHIRIVASMHDGMVKFAGSLELVESWAADQNEEQCQGSTFTKLMKYLPANPVMPTHRTWCARLPTMHLEQYLLDGLGYDGPCFEENLLPMGADGDDDQSFDKDAADHAIAACMATIARQKKEGLMPQVCVRMAARLPGNRAYSAVDIQELIEVDGE